MVVESSRLNRLDAHKLWEPSCSKFDAHHSQGSLEKGEADRPRFDTLQGFLKSNTRLCRIIDAAAGGMVLRLSINFMRQLNPWRSRTEHS